MALKNDPEIPVDHEGQEEQAPDFVSGEDSPPAGDDTQGGAETPEGEAEPEGQEVAAEEAEQLLSQEEIDSLKADPEKLVARMQQAYTQKTQKLAEERKVARLLNEYPDETLQLLARQRGWNLSRAAEEAVAKVDDETRADMEQLFGTELAEKLTPVLEKIADRVAAKRVAPLEQHRDQAIADAAREQTTQTLEVMDTKYPGWKKHESKMLKLAEKIQPTNKMTALEYSEMLYKLARADEQVADRTGALVKGMQRSAQASESRHAGVASSRVQPGPPGKITFEQAFEAARKGIRFSH